VPDPCDIAQFTSLDCNENGVPDECDGGGLTEVLNLFDPPLELVENDSVLDDLLVIDVGVIEDVDFTIDIGYRIGDLTVLLSHGGATITLIDRPGHPEVFLGNGQLGYDIVLDDEGRGGPIEDQGNFGPPFEPITSPPSYTPDDPLSTFDGMPSEGVWTVHILTSPNASPAGSFNDWGLAITRAAVPVGPCDCNDNGVPDQQDIADGTSSDANGNGVPDECEGAPGDLDGDGAVGILDLLLLLGAWGSCGDCGNCPADLDGDCAVGVTDFLILLANWS
jgi:subtilisin-like proprotein convertase family protein